MSLDRLTCRVRPIAAGCAVMMLLAGILGACADADCTPTRTTASPATKVDLAAASRSSVIEARLTAHGSDEPIGGRTLRFAVSDDGAELYEASGSTGDDGFARIDLKRADPAALQAIARGDEFSASFAGDGTYCASSGRAEFRLARTPTGAPAPPV